MKIEIGKRYRTKRGELVRRVLRVDSLTSTMYPVLVEMENGDVRAYTPDGAYYHSTSFPSGRDLIEVHENEAAQEVRVHNVMHTPKSVSILCRLRLNQR